MSMRPSLTLKIGQQLRMTPQLQQAIKLLQLSTLDLQQEIQEALDSNLMLEEFDDTAETAAAADAENLDETTRLDDPSAASNFDDAEWSMPDLDFENLAKKVVEIFEQNNITLETSNENIFVKLDKEQWIRVMTN